MESYIISIGSKKLSFEELNHYYPYGTLFGESTGLANSTQPYKYSGKELDRMHGLDLHDHGARWSDTNIGRWYKIDLLAEKYYDSTPYGLCGNNPIKYIDKDGRKIRFAKGSTEKFKRQFAAAVQYLKKHKVDGLLYRLEKRKEIIYIQESSSSEFLSSKKIIEWAPTLGLSTTEGKEISPSTILNHEVDHALQSLENPQQQTLDKQNTNSKYDNKEEERVITGSEQRTALALGEIETGEVTRLDHGGFPYETISPTSTKGTNGEGVVLNEIIITP